MAANSVPPVTFPPCCSFSLTGFQTAAPAGGSKAPPNVHLAGSNGPVLVANGGGVVTAPLSTPAGAARGKRLVPGSALPA